MARPPTRHSKTRRDPVTIDLEADRLSPEASTTTEAQSDVPPGPATGDDPERPPENDPAAEPRTESTEPFPGQAGVQEEEPAGGYRAFETEGTDESELRQGAVQPERPRHQVSPLLAGLAGGLVALAGAGILQAAGVLPSPGTGVAPADVQALRTEMESLRSENPGPAVPAELRQELDAAGTRMDELAARVDALNTELGEMKQSRSGGTGADPGPLQERLDRLEQDLAALRQQGAAPAQQLSGLDDRLSTTETAASAAAAAARANDSRLADLERGLADLQQNVTGLSRDLQERSAQPKLAVTVAAAALRQAVDRGGPFATELEAFAALAPNAPGLAELRSLAATGVASSSDILDGLPAAVDAMLDASRPADTDAGFVDSLLSSARSLVKVRPVGPVEGAGVPETVARLEAAARDGNLAKALAEFDSLPAPVKTAGQPLADKLRARLNAQSLVEQAAAEALKAA